MTLVILGISILWVILTVHSLTIGSAIALLFFLAVFAVMEPIRVSCTLLFFCSAFPKAGVKLSNFPIPILLFGLVIAVILARLSSETNVANQVPPSAKLVALLFGGVVVIKVIAFSYAGLQVVLPLVAWTILPMMLYCIGRGLPQSTARSLQASLERGFVVAILYGIAQTVFGTSVLSLPGLTSAFGDNLAEKHNEIVAANGTETSKIFSTYQNGNIFGLVAAVFTVAAFLTIVRRDAVPRTVLLLVGGLTVIGLSGSRTAVICLFAGMICVLFVTRTDLNRKVFVIGTTVLATVTVFLLRPDLVARYTISELQRTGGSGRTSLWAAQLAQFTWQRWILGFGRWEAFVDGWVGFLLQIGIVGAVLVFWFAWSASRGRTLDRIILLVLALGATFDGSYALFPTWFLPCTLMALNVVVVTGTSQSQLEVRNFVIAEHVDRARSDRNRA